MIGSTIRILDALLLKTSPAHLTNEIIITLIAEVSALTAVNRGEKTKSDLNFSSL